MKKVGIIICLFCMLFVGGCANKELDSAKIVRDDERIGGSLSFVYDKNKREVYIGGQDEVIQYSSDELNEGNRVGLKIIAPQDVTSLKDASLKMNDVNYTNFLEEINGQEQRFFNIYPVFTTKDTKMFFTIKWQEGTKEQQYKIIIMPGTKFLGKDGQFSVVEDKE